MFSETEKTNKNTDLETLPWYRALKIVAYIWLLSAFFIPWFLRNPSGYPTYAVVVGNTLDGLFNVAAWVIVIYLLRKLVFYIAFGKQPRSTTPLRPLEDWADFRKVAIAVFVMAGALGYLVLLIWGR